MTGSDAKQADTLYKAIIDYYGNLSGSDITTRQVLQRDKITASGVIECVDSLDSQVLELQSQLISTDNNATAEGTQGERKAVIELAIELLG